MTRVTQQVLQHIDVTKRNAYE